MSRVVSGSVRKVSGGVITTVAGNGTSGFSGDNGPATAAQLFDPVSVAVDSDGKVYIADSFNNRVRLLMPDSPSCSYSVTPRSLRVQWSGGRFAIGIQTAPSCAWLTSNLPPWITLPSGSSGVGSGPATIMLVVAPNTTGVSRTATLSVAGVLVTVTQATHRVRPVAPTMHR